MVALLSPFPEDAGKVVCFGGFEEWAVNRSGRQRQTSRRARRPLPSARGACGDRSRPHKRLPLRQPADGAYSVRAAGTSIACGLPTGRLSGDSEPHRGIGACSLTSNSNQRGPCTGLCWSTTSSRVAGRRPISRPAGQLASMAGSNFPRRQSWTAWHMPNRVSSSPPLTGPWFAFNLRRIGNPHLQAWPGFSTNRHNLDARAKNGQ
jgi:hypothetical protein